MEDETEYSVIVSNVYKRYSPNIPVLKGICMKIPKGSMYGLIGPSGCGKTTLLQSILGTSKIDSGTIKLAVKYWKEIGFMPQNVSLHTELQVNEIFVFYGAIFGIFGDELNHRINELADLLELPPLTQLIDKCSGGQQRRISLAITLFHNPNLVLLDEPTVGLDTVLAHKIWAHLRNLSLKQGKTILITTHYMEDAKSLHMIGLMRGGVLLAEKSPQTLMNDFNCNELDDVFLQLSTKQETSQRNEIPDDHLNKSTKVQTLLKNDKEFSTDHLWAQIYKNYKWTLRNIPVTLFILSLPVILSFISTAMFSDVHTDSKMGFYSEEMLNTSCQEYVSLGDEDCPPTSPFSCTYLDKLKNYHPIERFDSIEAGQKALKNGDIFIFIYFPYEFTENIFKRLSLNILVENVTFDDSTIDIWMDTTIHLTSQYGKFNVYKSLQETIEEKFRDCGIPTKLSRMPLNLEKLIYGKMDNNYSRQMYPHFLTSFLFYTTFVYTTASLLVEKTSGVLERVQMNGMTSLELITANFIVQIIVVNIQNILSLFTVHVILKEKYNGDMTLMYIILLLSEILGSELGLLYVTYTKHSLAVNYTAAGAILAINLTNGMIWPKEAVHWLIRPFAQLIPINMASASYSQVMVRGYSLKHHLVYSGILYIVGWLIAVLALTSFRIKRNNNQL